MKTKTPRFPPAVLRFFKETGRIGGSSRSPRKSEASRIRELRKRQNAGVPSLRNAEERSLPL